LAWASIHNRRAIAVKGEQNQSIGQDVQQEAAQELMSGKRS